MDEHPTTNRDELINLLGDVSGEQPVVWASRIIGFGEVTYTYESGRSGVMPVLAFSPPHASTRST